MVKTLIFDLDNTLFDTSRFREDVFQLFESLGMTADHILGTAKEIADAHHGNYDFDTHVSLLETRHGLDTFARELVEFCEQDFKRYVTEDTYETLQFLKEEGCHMILITKGIPALQNMKIDKAGLREYFHDVRICENKKEEVLKELNVPLRSIFVNDNWQETERIMKEVSHLTYVLFVRPDGYKFYDLEKIPVCSIHLISEIRKILK